VDPVSSSTQLFCECSFSRAGEADNLQNHKGLLFV